MAVSYYGADNYGEGNYSQTDYVYGSASVSCSISMTAESQRVKDNGQLIASSFVMAVESQRVKDSAALISSLFSMSAIPQVVFTASADITGVFQVTASGSYTASGEAAIGSEYTIELNPEAGPLWNNTTVPGVTWQETTAEQWNG
jgi:hypothetical protein